jgi:hypothetical protein
MDAVADEAPAEVVADEPRFGRVPGPDRLRVRAAVAVSA